MNDTTFSVAEPFVRILHFLRAEGCSEVREWEMWLASAIVTQYVSLHEEDHRDICPVLIYALILVTAELIMMTARYSGIQAWACLL